MGIFDRLRKKQPVIEEPAEVEVVQPVADDTEVPPPPPSGPRTSTTASVMRHTDQVTYDNVQWVRDGAPGTRTLIVQYTHAYMEHTIKDEVRSRRPKNAESFIGEFIKVDVFVNIGDSQSQLNGNRWMSIVYECLEGNEYPDAMERYSDAAVIRVYRSTEPPTLALRALLGGGK